MRAAHFLGSPSCCSSWVVSTSIVATSCLLLLAQSVRAAPSPQAAASSSLASNSTSNASGNSTSPSSNVTTVSVSNVTTIPLGTRAHHGLGRDWSQVNSIYVGFLPDWSRENPIDINRELGKPMAIIGDYVDISADDMSLSQVTYHNDAIVRLKDSAVYAPAIRPRMTLDQWTDEMSQAVASMAANMNKQGMTVWLRFAWEMNGGWYEWGNQPEQYKAAFISVTNAVRQATNETYMLWSPNVRYGETDSLAGYSQYYPGEQYVDIAGLSLYSPAEEGQVADSGAFVSALSSFSKLYGPSHPLIISETGAPYTYSIPSSMESSYCNDCDISGPLPDVSTLTPMPSSAADEEAMKIGWLEQIVSDKTAGHYPNLTAVCFFNYFKFGSTHGDSAASMQDFRNVGGHGPTEDRFRQIVGNVSAYQGGYDGAATRGVHVDAFTLLASLGVGILALSVLT